MTAGVNWFIGYDPIMNQIGKLLLWPVVLGLGWSVQGVTPDNRYNTIVERNVFRLTSPPPPAPVPPPVDAALERNIELSGISTVDGQKKAWFVIKPKPGSKDLPKYVSLAEQEEQEFLRVVGISEAEGEVNVLNSGNSMVLSFKNNGTKAILGVPAAVPAPVAATGSVIAQPAGASPIAGLPAGYGSAPARGGRQVTVAGGLPATIQGNTVQGNNFQGNIGQPNDGGLRSIPNRQLRLSPIAGQQPGGNEIQVDPVTQRRLMETQKAVYEAAGEPLPPLPPMTPRNGGTPPAPPSLPQ